MKHISPELSSDVSNIVFDDYSKLPQGHATHVRN